jgi:hypothetical protein
MPSIASEVYNSPIDYLVASLQNVAGLVADAAKVAWERIVWFAQQVAENWQTIILMVLAAVGLTWLLSQIPFEMEVPTWMESSMVAPVVSCVIVGGLAASVEMGQPCGN